MRGVVNWLVYGLVGLGLSAASVCHAARTRPTVIRDEAGNYSFEVPARSDVEPDSCGESEPCSFRVWPPAGGAVIVDVWDGPDMGFRGHFVDAWRPGSSRSAVGLASVVRSRNRHGIELIEYCPYVQKVSARCARGADTVYVSTRCDSGWVRCDPYVRVWTDGPFWVAKVPSNGHVRTVHIGWEVHGPVNEFLNASDKRRFAVDDSVSASVARQIASSIRAVRK
jgi:hypothetical protein